MGTDDYWRDSVDETSNGGSLHVRFTQMTDTMSSMQNVQNDMN